MKKDFDIEKEKIMEKARDATIMRCPIVLEHECMRKDSIESKKNLAISFIISGIVGLIVLFIVLCAALVSMQAKADLYIKIGSGYKLIETDHIVRTTGEKVYFNTGGKLSARIEIGKESGNWSYGISHHSQWFSGFPVNEDGNEYQKTELFIDYKFTL